MVEKRSVTWPNSVMDLVEVWGERSYDVIVDNKPSLCSPPQRPTNHDEDPYHQVVLDSAVSLSLLGSLYVFLFDPTGTMDVQGTSYCL